jgi:ECF sigma factor
VFDAAICLRVFALPIPSRGRSPTLSKTRTSVLYEMLTTKRALDGEDVAEGLSISRSTVTREWQTARASMHRRLTDARARGDS